MLKSDRDITTKTGAILCLYECSERDGASEKGRAAGGIPRALWSLLGGRTSGPEIWFRGDYDTIRLFILSEKPVRVVNPGDWNRLGRPEFRSADPEIDGCRLTGDVEIHFRETDWKAHRHHLDPAYDNVALHVLLFSPPAGREPIRTSRGRAIETVILIDLLWHDLEEYVFNDAAASASGVATEQVLERLVSVSRDVRVARCYSGAPARGGIRRCSSQASVLTGSASRAPATAPH
jgi:hypothetical protein